MGAPALLTRVAFGNSILFLAIGSTPVGCSVRLRSLPALAAWHICSVAALIRHCCMCFLRPGVFYCLVAPARAARVQPGLSAIVLRAVPCPIHRLIEFKGLAAVLWGRVSQASRCNVACHRQRERSRSWLRDGPAAPLCALMPAALGWPAPFAGVRALSTSCPQLCDSHSTPAPPSCHRRLPASCGRGVRPICSIAIPDPWSPARCSPVLELLLHTPRATVCAAAWRSVYRGHRRHRRHRALSARPDGRGRRPGAMAAGAAPGAVGGGGGGGPASTNLSSALHSTSKTIR